MDINTFLFLDECIYVTSHTLPMLESPNQNFKIISPNITQGKITAAHQTDCRNNSFFHYFNPPNDDHDFDTSKLLYQVHFH